MTKIARTVPVMLLVLAGCGVSDPEPSGPSSSAVSTIARSYPGLYPNYRGKFRPDHSDLGGRSNAELATLLPAAGEFPASGEVREVNTAAEDGAGLGTHGQTDGETRPAQCLYTPFGKTYSRADDGSDWNLYYAAARTQVAPDGSTITVTVNRQREGSDVFALTTEWIKGCGAYEKAWPSFARPQSASVSVRDTFGPAAAVDGVPTYRYTSDVTPLGASATQRPGAKQGGDERIALARVRSVVVVVQGTGAVEQADLDRLLAAVIAKANSAK